MDKEMYDFVTAQDISKIDLEEGGSTISMQVLSSDDQIYHVKLPHKNRNNSMYEYFAHIIANQIEAPIPDGSFVNFSREHYEQLKNSIQTQIDLTESTKGFRPNSLDKYLKFLDNELAHENQENFVLFGILYIEGAVDNLTKDEFYELINEVKNLDKFYSLYAFDLYLDNSDRHIKNILIISGLNIAYLIDHDKIFAQRNLNPDGLYSIDKTLFRCTKNIRNEYLYNMITTEDQYLQTISYAQKIYCINTDIIKDELNRNYYNLGLESLELIKNYFLYRKDYVVEKYTNFKERCYENIS